MNLELQDQVAVVSGSSRGIGLAIARAFLREGARVAISGRDEAALGRAGEACAKEFGADRVMSLGGDLADASVAARHAETVYRAWGRVDALVANAGTGSVKPGWEVQAADWEHAFRANLWPSVRLVEAFLPRMVAAGRGSVAFIGSIAGLEGTSAPLTYSAAKAALANYSKNLSLQVGPRGVRVNCVAPGNVLFPGGSWEKNLAKRDDAFRRDIEAGVALRRFGKPEEIADVVAFLASARASFITGACIVCDGGQTRTI